MFLHGMFALLSFEDAPGFINFSLVITNRIMLSGFTS
jgi:hypothetical protein